MSSRFLLYRDADDVWFIRIGLGVFWEYSGVREEAKEFHTRAAAVKVLHLCGKHLEGWRVVMKRG